MQPRIYAVALALAALPGTLAGQAATAAAAPARAAASPSPVADALRAMEHRYGPNLIAAAEAMPAEKFNYAPTPAQMSFAHIQTHLAEGNDFLCGKVAGVAAPTRTPVDTTAGKDKLVARLKETFAFCDSALAKVDDSKLGEQMTLFGPNPYTRAMTILITVGDWLDHYSQEANYLRLNGVLPPTARPRTP
jgi:hypothetical protein